MRKIKILLLACIVCLSVAACKSGDQPDEKKADENETIQEDSKKDGSSADLDISQEGLDGEDSTQSDKREYFTLYTEDKQRSIQIQSPEGYQPLEYSTETWLDFEMSDKSGQDSSQLMMILLDKSEAEAAEMMMQEVQYISSANATGDIIIEEIQSKNEEGRDVSYFHYFYITEDIKTEGYRVWSMLQNGCIFACTIENKGIEAAAPDIEGLVQELLSGIQE